MSVFAAMLVAFAMCLTTIASAILGTRFVVGRQRKQREQAEPAPVITRPKAEPRRRTAA